MSTFTCSSCLNEYNLMDNEEWNDKKAMEEYKNNFPETQGDPVAVICDDCYIQVNNWLATKTEKEKKSMRHGIINNG